MGNDHHRRSGVVSRSTSVFTDFPEKAATPSSASLRIERRLLQQALRLVGSPPLCFVLWDGREVSVAAGEPRFRIHLRDRGALWCLVGYPEYYFPELYTQGRILVEGDLERLLEVVQGARCGIDPNDPRLRLLSALFRPRSGSLAQARENVHQHYDLGNDFYRLWLDEQLLYTCAYFPTPETNLEQAQVAKMDHVCRKLRLQPGERVVEAGCGWGALALHMAREYGVRVRAFNISRTQLELARERARREGLEDRVEFVEGDYREIRGQYDAFVSVGMLEHVGPARYPELGRVMDRSLPANGRGLIHSIGADRPGPMNSWIERRIFPGARPPSLTQMMTLFGPHRFSVLDVENLRLHYAQTLSHWLRRFEASRGQVQSMFGPRFVRIWRFYLATSQASFASGYLQLYQVLFSRRGCNEIPRTRHYLYANGTRLSETQSDRDQAARSTL